MAIPVLQNQNPAPGSSGKRGDATVYLEVIESVLGLNASSVQIWFDGVPAWEGSVPESGFTGTRTAVTDGFGYSIDATIPLPADSTITVRVRAEDTNTPPAVLDTTYTFGTSIFLDTLDVNTVSTSGGSKIVATGLFPIGEAPDAYFWPSYTCYGGPGKGYSPISEDGLTIELYTPPMPKAGYALVAEFVSKTVSASPVYIVERNWPQTAFEARRRFPPWTAVGARRLMLEELE
jgi:hypothetical protein